MNIKYKSAIIFITFSWTWTRWEKFTNLNPQIWIQKLESTKRWRSGLNTDRRILQLQRRIRELFFLVVHKRVSKAGPKGVSKGVHEQKRFNWTQLLHCLEGGEVHNWEDDRPVVYRALLLPFQSLHCAVFIVKSPLWGSSSYLESSYLQKSLKSFKATLIYYSGCIGYAK